MDNSSGTKHETTKHEVLNYQGYLARVVSTVSFACIIGILGFDLDRRASNDATLILFCASLPITLAVGMMLADPRHHYHRSCLMGVAYFFGLITFFAAFVRLVWMHSAPAGATVLLLSLGMSIILSQSHDRFEKKKKQAKKAE